MTNLVEKDSPAPALLLIFMVMIVFAAGGLGIAYLSGFFGGSTTVLENNQTVENKTMTMPVEASSPPPPHAPDPERSAQSQPDNRHGN